MEQMKYMKYMKYMKHIHEECETAMEELVAECAKGIEENRSGILSKAFRLTTYEDMAGTLDVLTNDLENETELAEFLEKYDGGVLDLLYCEYMNQDGVNVLERSGIKHLIESINRYESEER